MAQILQFNELPSTVQMVGKFKYPTFRRIPATWPLHVVKDSRGAKMADTEACFLLAYIADWFRPAPIFDPEDPTNVVGYRALYQGDAPRITTKKAASSLNLEAHIIKKAWPVLEGLGICRYEIRDVEFEGTIYKRQRFVFLDHARFEQISTEIPERFRTEFMADLSVQDVHTSVQDVQRLAHDVQRSVHDVPTPVGTRYTDPLVQDVPIRYIQEERNNLEDRIKEKEEKTAFENSSFENENVETETSDDVYINRFSKEAQTGRKRPEPKVPFGSNSTFKPKVGSLQKSSKTTPLLDALKDIAKNHREALTTHGWQSHEHSEWVTAVNARLLHYGFEFKGSAGLMAYLKQWYSDLFPKTAYQVAASETVPQIESYTPKKAAFDFSKAPARTFERPVAAAYVPKNADALRVATELRGGTAPSAKVLQSVDEKLEKWTAAEILRVYKNAVEEGFENPYGSAMSDKMLGDLRLKMAREKEELASHTPKPKPEISEEEAMRLRQWHIEDAARQSAIRRAEAEIRLKKQAEWDAKMPEMIAAKEKEMAAFWAAQKQKP